MLTTLDPDVHTHFLSPCRVVASWSIECCVCHRVRRNGEWVPGGRPAGTQVGLERCPDCLAAMETEAADPLPLRIVVADDNQDAADTLGELLRMYKAEVAVAYDGPAALRAADGFHPDAVLLDINMPGMDGCEVARRLRARADIHPVLLVAVTAVEHAAGRRRTADSGFDLHLVKPADPRALVAALSEHRRWLRRVGVTAEMVPGEASFG